MALAHPHFTPSALSLLGAFARLSHPQALQTLLRSAGYKLRPPKAVPYSPRVNRATQAALSRGAGEPRQLARILRERRLGATPTIVLGGFVPDSTEQVYLLRSFLLRRGSVYYLNYAPGGFSLDLICAQLDDLVAELSIEHGQRPVVLGVSFGAGIALEWLRRTRAQGRTAGLAGLVFVSPVACIADVLDPAEPKPSTLLGRALRPFVDPGLRIDRSLIEKSRSIFTKMFDAGAQNRASIAAVMTADELELLRGGVLDTIRAIDFKGASERVGALCGMPAPSAWREPELMPLCEAPVLVLYAEKESAVLAESSPTRLTLQATHPPFFPLGSCRVVTGGDSPVQHASLVFHFFQFLPPIVRFYHSLKPGRIRLAA
jgi:pimeloyl-ACP methyl ester carboxylesterase